jgi:hypothetical protein
VVHPDRHVRSQDGSVVSRVHQYRWVQCGTSLGVFNRNRVLRGYNHRGYRFVPARVGSSHRKRTRRRARGVQATAAYVPPVADQVMDELALSVAVNCCMPEKLDGWWSVDGKSLVA